MELSKSVPAIIALAGTGILGAGFFLGTVPLTTLIVWLTGLGIGVAHPSPFFNNSSDDDPPAGVP